MEDEREAVQPESFPRFPIRSSGCLSQADLLIFVSFYLSFYHLIDCFDPFRAHPFPSVFSSVFSSVETSLGSVGQSMKS